MYRAILNQNQLRLVLMTLLSATLLLPACGRKAPKTEDTPAGQPQPSVTPNPGTPTPRPHYPTGENDFEFSSERCPNTLTAGAGADLLPEDVLRKENSQMEWRLVELSSHTVIQWTSYRRTQVTNNNEAPLVGNTETTQVNTIAALATHARLSEKTSKLHPVIDVSETCNDISQLTEQNIESEAQFPISIHGSTGAIEADAYTVIQLFGALDGRPSKTLINHHYSPRDTFSQLYEKKLEDRANNQGNIFQIIQNDENSMTLFQKTKVDLKYNDTKRIDTTVGRYIKVGL